MKWKRLLSALMALILFCLPVTASAMEVHHIGMGNVVITSQGSYKKNEKVMYLTFDDGPGPYTDKLLDILKKNNVKATFFVTNGYPKYRSCIAREAKEGHMVAVHSYSHNYKTIYSSEKAYWDDYKKMDDIIYEQTGRRATMMRFPGGSSNTVSRHYSKGIMTRLSRGAAQRGIVYTDWNAMAGDAGEVTTSDGVYRYIVNTTGRKKQVVVLCHDIKPYTVNAMDRVIKWGKQNGYQFRAMTPGGYIVHQKIAN